MERLSPAERKTWDNFIRTELGQKVMGNIKAGAQNYLDQAILNSAKGQAAKHDLVMLAKGYYEVLALLQPTPKKEKE